MSSFDKRCSEGSKMIDSYNNQFFFEPKMIYPSSIDLFGVRWEQKIEDKEDSFVYYYLFNSDFGEFVISEKAFNNINTILNQNDYYKVLSLIYEKSINKYIYYVTMKDEKDTLQFRNSKYISVSIEEFLNKFPDNIFEKQHRALLSLYKLYPEYGEQINYINKYIFFSKNDNEWKFIYSSMVKKHWLTAGLNENGIKDPFFVPYTITADGWIEIERAIQNSNKKQAFIAMKFKDMDNIYKAIYRAIEDAQFIPLRIDKKEHINQITNEIQYEISQSGLIVADVTGQNQGVYFEAGYAIGLNIPVIWTCNNEEKEKIHFDTRQYNTILWKDENDLYEQLKNRIIAIMGLRENQGHSHA
jgi:nucleoside 2-deoxyribosyltransferase